MSEDLKPNSGSASSLDSFSDNSLNSSLDNSYPASYFDAMYQDNSDPWQYQTRWYEKRKRDISLAVLPQAQYANAIELGCGNGVFSELLAQRCQALLSLDGNQHAVQLAQQRLARFSHVKVIQGLIPQALNTLSPALNMANTKASNTAINPSSNKLQPPYDLIVISEVLYYLAPADIESVITWVGQSLAINGTLFCCHWRYPIEGFEMTGETVHQRFYQVFGSKHNREMTNSGLNEQDQRWALNHQSSLVDSDFLLDVWQHSPKSVAMQENLV